MKGIKIFLKEEKTKNIDMIVNDIEISLKKRKTKSKDIVHIKIFLKMENKG